MTNRKLAYIIKDQKPLVLSTSETVQQACRHMRVRRVRSALVIDDQRRLAGIFTGRDAVRLLAEGNNAAQTPLARAMTHGGFRHLPVLEEGRLWGIVSRGDFTGMEIDRLDEETHLWECIR